MLLSESLLVYSAKSISCGQDAAVVRQHCRVCRAMVFGWSCLSDGDPNYSLTQVAKSSELFIRRFREPSLVPSGLSANHPKRRLGLLTEPSGSIVFRVIESKYYPCFAGPRITCSCIYKRSAGLRTLSGPRFARSRGGR